MKIGIIVQNFDVLPRSLAPKHVFEVHRRLRKKGIETIVITNDPFYKTKEILKIKDGFRIYTFNSSPFRFLLYIDKIASILEKENVDIVSFYVGITGSLLGCKIAEKTDKPALPYIYKPKFSISNLRTLKFRDLFDNFGRIFDLHNIIGLILPKFLIKHYLSKNYVLKILAGSNRVKERLGFLIPQKRVDVLPSGVDIKKFNPKKISIYSRKDDLQIEGQVVLYYGRASTLRGIDTLIDAFKTVKCRIPDAKLVLLLLSGAYTQKQMIIKKARALLGSSVKIFGSVENLEMFLGASTVVVLPFRYKTEIPEYPLTVLEPMSMGKPVITANIGAITEVIKNNENGLLVKPNDKKELTNAIIEVLNDRDFANFLGKNARETIEKGYNWEKIAKKTLLIYKEVLVKGGKASR